MNIDIRQLERWIGRSESRQERIAAAPAVGMAATLDRPEVTFAEGDILPAGWHWLYFLPVARQSDLGRDGHPKLGGFLPPIPLPGRMWAAGLIQLPGVLRIGDIVTRVSRIDSLSVKDGRSGPLVFLKLVHELTASNGVAIREVQDLVYRDHPRPGQRLPPGELAPVDETWRIDIRPDPVLLFRYSALTFNSHRIHYDRDYATRDEHYPALVVHGPLIATLLLELVHQHFPGKPVTDFRFRAVHPTFTDTAFSLCGKRGPAEGELTLWARNAEGILTMEASAKPG